MIEPFSYDALRNEVSESVNAQRDALERLREDVRPLKSEVRRIKPRSTTSISIVGTDGGNNQIAFDPFMVQVVRVADSSEQDYCFEVVSPLSDLGHLYRRHIDDRGAPLTPLGRMLSQFSVPSLHDLSVMIPAPPAELKPSWITVYRELQEWAVLLDLVKNQSFATDTLIMRDGWLRTKAFATGLFPKYRAALEQAIVDAYGKYRRRIYIAGVLKRSKVLQKYRLALALEGVLRTAYPAYVHVPASLQKKVFEWSEIVSRTGDAGELKDSNNMVGGEMFLVKFGGRPQDPVWAVDILASQVDQASAIFGFMLADAQSGFPMPFFPRSLQKAHEHACIEGLDIDVLQHHVSQAVRQLVGENKALIDEFELAAMGDGAAVSS